MGGSDKGTVRHLWSIASTQQQGLFRFEARAQFDEFAELLGYPAGTRFGA